MIIIEPYGIATMKYKKFEKQAITSLCFFLIWSAISISLAQTYSDYRVEGQSTLEPEKKIDEDVMLLIQKGRELYKQGIHQSAILAYQNAIRLDPRNELARLELGKIALETKNWAYAIRMLSELATLRPSDKETRRVLMEIYYTYEEPLLEMKTAYELLRLSPSDTALLNRIASLYELHEMYLDEINILERLVRLVPNESKYLWRLAQLYAQQKNQRQEIHTYERLLKLQPNNTTLLKRLARLYSTVGNFVRQIDCFQNVIALEPDNDDVREALILAYGDALSNQHLTFNLKRARRICEQYIAKSPSDQYIREISDAITLATGPMVIVDLNNHQYDFAGKMNHLENTAIASIQGPIAGSQLTFKNSYIMIEAPNESPILKNYQLHKMKVARLYRGQLTWKQKLQKVNARFTAGALKFVSGSSGMSDDNPQFISALKLNYPFSRNLSISAGYDLNYTTLTPRAIAQNIYRHQFEFDCVFAPWEKFLCHSQFQLQQFSDQNQGTTFNLELEYSILRTLFKKRDIEDYEPLGYDDTGTQLSIGLGYEYINYNEERDLYPTAINERILNLSFAGEQQIFQSIVLKAEGFAGYDNKDQNIWGYHVAIEKHLNWRLNFAIGYENFRSPYVYENKEYMNRESRLYLGVATRF